MGYFVMGYFVMVLINFAFCQVESSNSQTVAPSTETNETVESSNNQTVTPSTETTVTAETSPTSSFGPTTGPDTNVNICEGGGEQKKKKGLKMIIDNINDDEHDHEHPKNITCKLRKEIASTSMKCINMVKTRLVLKTEDTSLLSGGETKELGNYTAITHSDTSITFHLILDYDFDKMFVICVMEDNDYILYSNSNQLKIYERMYVRMTPAKQTIEQGDAFSLTCHWESNNDVTVFWYHNGERINSPVTTRQFEKKEILTVSHSTSLSSGHYECDLSTDHNIREKSDKDSGIVVITRQRFIIIIAGTVAAVCIVLAVIAYLVMRLYKKRKMCDNMRANLKLIGGVEALLEEGKGSIVVRPMEKRLIIDNSMLHVGEMTLGGGYLQGEMGGVPGQMKSYVAVKKFESALEVQKEAEWYKSCFHKNVLELRGICEEMESYMLVVESLEFGSLEKFLRCRDPDIDNQYQYINNAEVKLFTEGSLPRIQDEAPLDLKDLVYLAVQPCDALEYLVSQQIELPELRLMSCVVGARMTVKIGNFGRRDKEDDECDKKDGDKFAQNSYVQSDCLENPSIGQDLVWSYGVVLWQILSFGKTPYYGESSDRVVERVTEGEVLEKPGLCPEILYHDTMVKCWRKDMADRITFLALCSILQGFLDEFREPIYNNLP